VLRERGGRKVEDDGLGLLNVFVLLMVLFCRGREDD